ncbi:carbohydrate-binding protein [Superficieibacter sp.]|uniref:carbohydrate-binding protein n=1 Tax=Superficieibacter sp. TaxID=2303322 RepID=UPI0028A9767B|nr:carbohydrate-binding protein [Superficieibacter sp.]
MKINIFTKTMLGMGLVCASVPAFALEAWNNQQGGDKYQVIFDGKVYENAWWVSSTNCPANAKPNDASNPWRYQRDATAQEISQVGNPQSCNSDQKPVEPVVPDTTPVTPVPATDNTDKAEEYAIEAWQHQEGGTTWHVIYDGAIYQNAWWVAASNCPGNAKADDASNPWRYLRDATAAEEAKYGNPTSCDTDGEDDVPVPPAPPVPDPVPSDDPTPSQDDDSTYALEAWSGQEGSTIYHVIFDGNVYKNAWWVGSKDCPLTASPTNANNPWTFERVATPAEISQYGNPQTCEIAGNDTTTYPAWSNESAYNANDKVEYNNATYVTQKAQDAWGFAPGGDNPWQKYEAVQPWSASTVYVKGDRVVVDGMVYEALFWTQHDDPSDVANQNPTGDNSRPWKPLGKLVEYSSEELSNAPQYDAGTLYENGTLIRFNGENYVAQTKVQKVSPTDTNPWRIFVDWKGTKERVGTPKNSWPKHVYAPYVDFTLNTIPDFAALAKNENVNHFTLAFVVSKDADTCLPTWGTSYGMQDYAQYSKIKALREAGGDVMLSIGGANNAPLAASCKNVDDLMQHYYDIVDNLNLQVLDFDIEGTWVADQASIERRNLAVKKVQDKWKSEGKDIGVWYTLPILPTGLTPDGMNVLRDAQAKGVELAGVNVMTMDYGNAICQSAGTEGQNIHGKCATSAIESLHTQLKGLFTEKSDAEIDAMMGTTPMIGLNDVQGETFYLSDARLVMEDAQKRKLGMIGIWSIARDVPGGNYVSPEFHGLTEQQAPKYAFSEIFAPFTKQ